ncbi:MAG: hypothetical protein CO042_00750 [Parcubacteria group bacterium CG_4_9_14_0_2_um_filter_41_8]|nr:MAG: hypothetical protein COW93_01075 [Parcubacteria group bacterium CG22_combo_CG10-13_8_21_14_all_41_9]PJC41000.1 MAG: hypothetical protein CO042_00750 [Parcubacteria group bacterium CG_4_9_14_0_2_um_filter_41_8]
MKEANIIWLWRAVLSVLSVGLLVWLFWQNLVPSGILVLEHRKGDPASPISDLHPEKRIIELDQDNGAQRFYIDPVYFDAKAPREFETVTVQVAWQNQSQPILELGARKTRDAWGFVLKPLQNKIIDDVLTQSTQPPLNPPLNTSGEIGVESPQAKGEVPWQCQRYDQVIFCQKEQKYANLSAFFANPQGRILSYNYVMPENLEHDKMNVNTDMNEYDYLIATYRAPESLGNDWYQSSVIYNWQDFDLYINEISFLVSAPELNKGHGEIVLGDIIITLKRDPLDWEGFWEYVKNQLRRLKK